MGKEDVTAGIKNIIYDLGGVILNIDYNLTVKAFVELGVENFGELYSQAKQNTTFDAFETGEMTSAEFREVWRKYLTIDKTNEQIDAAWNSIILDLPENRMEVLDRTGRNFRTFLLSNTNSTHVKCFTKLLNDEYGEGVFEGKFEKHYYSNEIGKRKPNADAFLHVLEENVLKAEETLFIDDSIQHIEAAQELGIRAYHLTGEETIVDLFAHIP